MNTGFQVRDQHAAYFVTCSVVEWIDIFSRRCYRDIIVESLAYCVRHKGLRIYAYVAMSNHLHLIVRTEAPHRLSDTLRDFKRFTASKILKKAQTRIESRRSWMLARFRHNASRTARCDEFQFWTHYNCAKEVRTKAFFESKLRYIHNNPVKAGIVDFPEDYVYSSAYELSGRGHKLEICQWV